MTTVIEGAMSAMEFALPPDLEAHEPPEARGLSRDGVRLLVGSGSSVQHHRFADLPTILTPGDLLVVNTSATIPAAVRVLGSDLSVHFSTELPNGRWLVELRKAGGQATVPYRSGVPDTRYDLPEGASVTLTAPYSRDRLWEATVDPGAFGSMLGYLRALGRPIRYEYVPRDWPIRYYQSVFGTNPGSAEMPSASRPFTDRIVTTLVSAGVRFAPVMLHTGVASPEAHERPYPERFSVGEPTAALVNHTRQEGHRVIAVGTTAVRALESAVGPDRTVQPTAGWTDLIVSPDRGVQVVDGLLTGFHEPRASHLDMLAAIAGTSLLSECYREAIAHRYLWHEFGDLNLLVP
ncbi:S-adenosylmethionine:tRNA ribosyltransferase-isomerase [Alloactinosynnema sp. L-07]|uniref:S-adenosylmethionine:tRNA ribosyltransferase-isomerase n=1 Tax=Alloactinosynnema sp. L-07 TaxID=1653480 RepID=UPI000B08B4F9|nr:S-adenosylmethionine:tRNA ribosyltransferase-isomerase [Alloactinosynnema sp. L-07]